MSTSPSEQFDLQVVEILADLDQQKRAPDADELLVLKRAETRYAEFAHEDYPDALERTTAEEQLGRVRSALAAVLEGGAKAA